MKSEIKDEEENEKVIQLLNCPFCGGPVHHVSEDNQDIECDMCAYTFYDTSVDNQWWNTRHKHNTVLALYRVIDENIELRREQSKLRSNYKEW